ncbi:MAG TPA: hypothetical protein VEW42_00645 [Candidatus Eisenbacteria bacterium]|nr:hypothetical protein [Candidatus Eisenbacteria bacterium]
MTEQLPNEARCMFGNGVCRRGQPGQRGCPNFFFSFSADVLRKEGRLDDLSLFARMAPVEENDCENARNLRSYELGPGSQN